MRESEKGNAASPPALPRREGAGVLTESPCPNSIALRELGNIEEQINKMKNK